MDVLSVSPFRTGSVLWRSRPDRWTLTVICKGTYTLSPGAAALAAEQEEVRPHDTFRDGDPRRSLHAPSDLAPFKPRADVMLVGHAFAPRGELCRALTARLIVGELEKAIEVVSPRVWTREGELREGPRWNKMPLCWEHAAGGLDTWNPVGVSPNAAPDAYGQRLLPNLQPPGLRLQQWGDLFVPVGFGPIAPTWTLRRLKLGRRAEGWSDEGWPQIPLDDEFDGEFFQAAPPDQQLEALPDDVPLALEHLHPEHPRLATRLPGLHPHAFVEQPGAGPRDLVMTADTLWIDTDRGLCTVTWRGQVAVDGPSQAGRVVIALEEPGQHLTWTVVAARAGLPPLAGPPVDSASTPPGRRPLNTLPGRLSESTRSPSLGQPTLAGGALAPAPFATSGVESESEVEEVEAEVDAEGPRPTPRAGGRQNTMPMVAPRAANEHTLIGAAIPVRPEVRVPPASALELCWCSPALKGRLRKNAAWAQILSPSKGAARTTMTVVSVARADSDEAAEQALEGDVSKVMSRATPSAAELLDALFESTDEGGGALVPDLLLLEGELEPTFDALASVEAHIAAATPLSRAHPALAELLAHASAMARTPLQHAPQAAAALVDDLRAAWAAVNEALPADHLEALVARALLASRAYQRRDLRGETWVRALFTRAGGVAVPAYLPEPAARRLPLFRRLPVRLLAELIPQQDEHEEQPVALEVAALARVVTRPART